MYDTNVMLLVEVGDSTLKSNMEDPNINGCCMRTKLDLSSNKLNKIWLK